MSLILAGDATVYYEEYGTGETLILLPDLLGTIESDWRRFLSEFARSHHTVAVDLRGHGKTNNPAGVLHISKLVEDLHLLCESLEINRTSLCGYGFGGYLAVAYAAQHGDRINSLVLHGVRRAEARIGQGGFAGDIESLRKQHEPGNGPDGWNILLGQSRRLLEEISTNPISPETLAGLGCAVLLTVGDSDESASLIEAARLVRLLPHAELKILPETGHPIGSVRKDLFVEIVTSFLRKTTPSAV